MLLTLAASSMRSSLLPAAKGKKPKMDILDVRNPRRPTKITTLDTAALGALARIKIKKPQLFYFGP